MNVQYLQRLLEQQCFSNFSANSITVIISFSMANFKLCVVPTGATHLFIRNQIVNFMSICSHFQCMYIIYLFPWLTFTYNYSNNFYCKGHCTKTVSHALFRMINQAWRSHLYHMFKTTFTLWFYSYELQ